MPEKPSGSTFGILAAVAEHWVAGLVVGLVALVAGPALLADSSKTHSQHQTLPRRTWLSLSVLASEGCGRRDSVPDPVCRGMPNAAE